LPEKQTIENYCATTNQRAVGLIELPKTIRARPYNALKSSGTSPNFLITWASLKSPFAGSPVRLYTKSGKAPSHAAGVKAAERAIDKALAPKKKRLHRPE
jgi:hypothetical protein